MQLSDELVEKAARAFKEAAWKDAHGDDYLPLWTWKTLDESEKESARRNVRGLLEIILPEVRRTQITSEMIERGARALHAREARWLPPSWVEFTDWEAIGERTRQKYREAARRCLEAALGGDEGAGNR